MALPLYRRVLHAFVALECLRALLRFLFPSYRPAPFTAISAVLYCLKIVMLVLLQQRRSREDYALESRVRGSKSEWGIGTSMRRILSGKGHRGRNEEEVERKKEIAGYEWERNERKPMEEETEQERKELKDRQKRRRAEFERINNMMKPMLEEREQERKALIEEMEEWRAECEIDEAVNSQGDTKQPIVIPHPEELEGKALPPHFRCLRHLRSENHAEVYAVATEGRGIATLEAKAYALDDLPPKLYKYRHRNMKRFTDKLSIWIKIEMYSRTFVIYDKQSSDGGAKALPSSQSSADTQPPRQDNDLDSSDSSLAVAEYVEARRRHERKQKTPEQRERARINQLVRRRVQRTLKRL